MAFGVGAVAAAISAAISFTTMSIPKPEIYTTNGNSVKENEVYFSTEWPLTVKYTLVPYDDPMKNGEKFKENIPIIRSMAVSAKATLFGIKWSELESKDIIIGNNNELAIIDPNSPGSSIMKISACHIYGQDSELYGDDGTLGGSGPRNGRMHQGGRVERIPDEAQSGGESDEYI